MLFYYYAFNLRHLAHWSLPPERAPPWYGMEQAVMAPLSPIQVLSTKLSKKAKTHPIISHLKLIWTKVARIFKFDPFLNVSSSIWLNPKLRIGKFPIYWKIWRENGVVTLGDLYCHGSLKSFGDLVRQFNIPTSHFFRYLQLRHMLVGIFRSGAAVPQNAEFLDKIIKSYGKGHEAAVYYSMMIQTLGNGPISALQKTWERDLNLTFSDEEWNRICRSVKVVSRDARVRLIQFKIIHRFYWTPSRLFRLGLLPTSNCWRCKSEEGDLVHVLWSCDKVQQYWINIHDNLCEITEIQMPFIPRLFILGDDSVLVREDKHIKSFVQTSIMIGRQILIRGWKTEGVPSLQEWAVEMARVAAFEKMSYKQLGRLDLYEAKWGKYMKFLKGS